MLDRLRFMFGFVRAYRDARKQGISPDDAKLAATSRMFEERLGAPLDFGERVELPPDVVSLWSDPGPTFRQEGREDGWFGIGPFEISSAHLSLLAHARFSWDGAERGAPMLDPARPFGRSDLMAQLGEVFGETDAIALARRHVEMMYVLARVLRHGEAQTGRYALRNISAEDVRAAMRGYGGEAGLSDADLGLDADGMFSLAEDHLKLLREMTVEWPSQWEVEDRLDAGDYPAAAIDPKRPYGDFTYIEVDMARILGRLPPPPSDGQPAIFEPDPALAAHLQRLHWQMLAAMQVFVENAELAPGTYDL